jgi:hypothetical protein
MASVRFPPIADISWSRHSLINHRTIGLAMALDHKLKRQLTEARANICAQLEQLEREAGNPYLQSDSRSVYADLQRELHEIDALLEADGDQNVEAESTYQPMVKWYSDGTVGNPVRPTFAGRVIAIISVVFFFLYLAVAVLKAWVG